MKQLNLNIEAFKEELEEKLDCRDQCEIYYAKTREQAEYVMNFLKDYLDNYEFSINKVYSGWIVQAENL